MEEEKNKKSEKKKFSLTKNWKKYFFEFLMLFLAVFLGFVAENVREDYSEREQGMGYVRSFYEDLKTDTTKISAIIKSQEKKIKELLSISSCYDSINRGFPSTSCLTNLFRNSFFFSNFYIADRTIKQLTAGGYRLLSPTDADSIENYASNYIFYQNFQSTILQDAQNNIRKSNNLIFNYSEQLYKTPFSQGLPNAFNKTVKAPILFTADKALINNYFNELMVYSLLLFENCTRLKKGKEKQIRLLNYFNNKYHFE